MDKLFKRILQTSSITSCRHVQIHSPNTMSCLSIPIGGSGYVFKIAEQDLINVVSLILNGYLKVNNSYTCKMFVVLGIPWNIRGPTFNNPLLSKSLLIFVDFQIHWIYLVRRIIPSLLDVHLYVVPFLNFCIEDITALNNLMDKSWMCLSFPFILFLTARWQLCHLSFLTFSWLFSHTLWLQTANLVNIVFKCCFIKPDFQSDYFYIIVGQILAYLYHK